MKRGWLAWIIIALALGAAAYYFAVRPAADRQLNTGVRGMVSIGPTCPVQRMPPDPNCADRPYKADFSITNKYGYAVSKTASGADGKFEVSLPPGEYSIAPTAKTFLPRASAQSFTVPQAGFVEISIQFDSGIR